ncbi:hypothetical protein TNCT_365721, partial [Trichonephila clavata]
DLAETDYFIAHHVKPYETQQYRKKYFEEPKSVHVEDSDQERNRNQSSVSS